MQRLSETQSVTHYTLTTLMVGQRAAGLPARRFPPCKIAPPLGATGLGAAPDARGWGGKALPTPSGRLRPKHVVKGTLRANPHPFLLARTSLRGLRLPVSPLTTDDLGRICTSFHVGTWPC